MVHPGGFALNIMRMKRGVGERAGSAAAIFVFCFCVFTLCQATPEMMLIPDELFRIVWQFVLTLGPHRRTI